MRRAARIDDNQRDIVAALRSIGASVAMTHTLKGFVDVVVGYRGVNYLVEIKDGSKPKSARQLTDLEQKFHESWKGSVTVIKSVDEALFLLTGA